MEPSPLNERKPKIPKLLSICVFVAGIASLVGLSFMIFKAIEMVRSGRGLETYRTFWFVEFNWLSFLILLAATVLGIVIALVLRLREFLLWRSLEKKYASPKEHA
ncbi:MAG: hypothetical protein LBQ81_00785 [Zoogloeaceae bacterium]|jgi:hypothetical protein|nr:hypothetical protein [Zoogloeaceae bacterium]